MGNETVTMKVFGIGLPRTGTTSAALALMELGFRTCHTYFKESLLEECDAFFDTPTYADYPILDRLFPGAKFILTWRDPRAWAASFQRNLMPYFRELSETMPHKNRRDVINWRCYTQLFGPPQNVTAASLIAAYQAHRRRAEEYFHDRPQDLLLLDLDAPADHWEALCEFLACRRTATPFPFLNKEKVQAWEDIKHPNKR
jgi:hypothetical protein